MNQRTFANCLTAALLALGFIGPAFALDAPKAEFDCRWAGQPITIDGRLDDAAWKHAELIDQFYLPWLLEKSRPAKTSTKARLLWDREYLYFAAELEDADLYADIKEHDGQTWYNDVFELFFKPADDKPGYYELQVNAAGTVMDLFLPRRGAGGFRRFIEARKFHIEAKVRLNGTLNKWQDTDKGWTVEGRMPWTDFLVTGGRPAVDESWNFALCRYDYSVDFEGPELSTCAPLKSKRYPDFHHYEDYAKLIFRGPSRKTAARPYGIGDWSPVTTSRVKGSPDPPLPYVTERVFPKLRISYPVFMATEPGSRRMYFIDQPRPYAATRLCRTKGDPASGEFDVLIDYDKATAYSLCFHPRFQENGFIYVGANSSWNDGEPKKSRVIRYTIDRNTPNMLDVSSATTIIEWESDGHNGAAVAFGNDGMLYVTSGDGTSDSDTNLKGQGLDHLLAKVLRIDVDHPAEGTMYSVPADNPFVGQDGIVPETWAYGFRNPWRITVDRKTGRIWVGNNGQDLWEQAFLVEKGANYGWSVFEGSHPFYPNRTLGPHPVRKPTVEHSHSESRSLTGGVVYYGSRLPELRGAYVYGDHSTGKIWGVKHDGTKVVWAKELADTAFNITAFARDADGELLIADHRGNKEGGFYRLRLNRLKREKGREKKRGGQAHFAPKTPQNEPVPEEPVPEEPVTNEAATFPRKLSESGLFRSVKNHEMAKGLIPYSVNAPLWSDGAFKARWIALPPTMMENGKEVPAHIGFRLNRGWDFPDDTVLVKSFALEMTEGDPASRKWIETRFLTKQQGEWVGYSYAWNDEQTDGFLVEGEGRDRDFSIQTSVGSSKNQAWHFPSRTECMVCHSRAANFVLGLSTAQMNKNHDYDGVVDNQLRVLEHLGLLRVNWKSDLLTYMRKQLSEEGLQSDEINKRLGEMTATRNQRGATVSRLLVKPPEKYDALANPYDQTAELELRARSYLHANCSICHVLAGGGNAQMDLEYNATREKLNIFGVPPMHHTFGIKEAKLIAPGDPDRSVLLRRVSIRERGQMPQLATSVVDERAVKMLRDWIRAMKE